MIWLFFFLSHGHHNFFQTPRKGKDPELIFYVLFLASFLSCDRTTETVLFLCRNPKAGRFLDFSALQVQPVCRVSGDIIKNHLKRSNDCCFRKKGWYLMRWQKLTIAHPWGHSCRDIIRLPLSADTHTPFTYSCFSAGKTWSISWRAGQLKTNQAAWSVLVMGKPSSGGSGAD